MLKYFFIEQSLEVCHMWYIIFLDCQYNNYILKCAI